MSTEDYPVKQRVLSRVSKGKDLETHVRLIEIDGITSVAISDYIVSLDEYGRSYWLPNNPAVLGMLGQALSTITAGTTVN